MEHAIYNTSVYFKNTYEEKWIVSKLSKVIDSGVVDSPVLGKIPPISLSGGVKTLILIANGPDKVFNASICGDNCAKWISEKKVLP